MYACTLFIYIRNILVAWKYYCVIVIVLYTVLCCVRVFFYIFAFQTRHFNTKRTCKDARDPSVRFAGLAPPPNKVVPARGSPRARVFPRGESRETLDPRLTLKTRSL